MVSLTPYFPEGLWYDFYTKASFESKGQRFNISAPLDTIPVFIRGGYIIPQQSPLQTTTQSRKSKLQLLAASDSSEQGCGQLYWDDGDSLSKTSKTKSNNLATEYYKMTSFYVILKFYLATIISNSVRDVICRSCDVET